MHRWGTLLAVENILAVFEQIQLGQLLHEVEKIVNDTFLKNIAVKLTVPPDLWTVVGDPTQLHQVLHKRLLCARKLVVVIVGHE